MASPLLSTLLGPTATTSPTVLVFSTASLARKRPPSVCSLPSSSLTNTLPLGIDTPSSVGSAPSYMRRTSSSLMMACSAPPNSTLSDPAYLLYITLTPGLTDMGWVTPESGSASPGPTATTSPAFGDSLLGSRIPPLVISSGSSDRTSTYVPIGSTVPSTCSTEARLAARSPRRRGGGADPPPGAAKSAEPG